MYLVGGHHPHKLDAHRLVERSIASGERLVTDAEVLQEILHRYLAIHRRDAIQPAFEALLGIVDEVFPVELPDVQRAKEIVFSVVELSARDALHAAIIKRHRIEGILTFDVGFDRVPGVRRVLL